MQKNRFLSTGYIPNFIHSNSFGLNHFQTTQGICITQIHTCNIVCTGKRDQNVCWNIFYKLWRFWL